MSSVAGGHDRQAPERPRPRPRWPERAALRIGSQRSFTDNHGRCHARRAVGSAHPERSEGASKLPVHSPASTLPCRSADSVTARGTGKAQRRSRPEIAKTLRSAEAYGGGDQVRGWCVPRRAASGWSHRAELPLLVGRLGGAVLHNPGDPRLTAGGCGLVDRRVTTPKVVPVKLGRPAEPLLTTAGGGPGGRSGPGHTAGRYGCRRTR